ncbi:polysaccharide biosynthesis/export family protein [Variovorax sp. YR752]|uniref:polysaccharide biosynthesis/export family protein n=1 Tax=Variovorax sp. YR752 TaxID=1884383 RepID=UPI003137D321
MNRFPCLTSQRCLQLGAILVLGLAATCATAQSNDPLNTSPRGLTDLPARRPPLVAAPSTSGPAPVAPVPAAAPLALPPDPATAAKPIVFGSQAFTGRFGSETFAGFNPDYQIAVGDRISVRIWGAYTFEAVQPVDVKGNIFVPNVGPLRVLGVRNGDLNAQLESQLKRTFRSNVGIYATLEAAQPVKIFVTGFVRAPGLYGGLSSDSVLHYLDRAGGIDPDRGSYLQVDVLRAGNLRARVNLYAFLLEGRIDQLQLQDGDTLVVQPRRHAVQIGGEVMNPYIFELDRPSITGAELLNLARPRPSATHLSVVRMLGSERRSEYYALADAAQISIRDGDEVLVTSDKHPGTILVRIDGAHLGERTLVLPYGSQLKDAVTRIKPAPQARIEALQLFRKSVAERQKELIETSLRSLETYALTARSATSEEAALRGREAQQILEFIDRARQVQPRGQVILGDQIEAGNTLLADGDLIRVPEQSNLVLVSGEVLFPNALVFDSTANSNTYVMRAGGYTQGADRAKLIVLRQDGSVADGNNVQVRPGDEIMALPKIETKSIEITRGITQIIYQIAVAAKVLFDL